MSSLVELTKIYDSCSFDAISRSDRASAKKNRHDAIYDKFLSMRHSIKPVEKQQITHEHILNIGSKSMLNYKLNFNKTDDSPRSQTSSIKFNNEIARIENEIEIFKQELINTFQTKFDREKIQMKKVFLRKKNFFFVNFNKIII